MKRSRTAIASLTILGASLLAQGTASADPLVTITQNGAAVGSDAEGVLGAQIRLAGIDCPNGDGNAVMGEFISVVGDPLTVAEQDLIHIPVPVALDANGSFVWDTEIPMDHEIGAFHVRWYCASAPVTGMTDPAVNWLSAPMTMTMVQEGGLQRVRSGSGSGFKSVRSMASRAAAPMPSVEVRLDVDPDALPAIDRINIPGEQAAALKAKVDRRVRQIDEDRKQMVRILRRFPTLAKIFDKPISNEDYVRASYDEFGRRPAARAVDAAVARLDAGQIRVQVVEDIALTVHDAGWWVRHG